MSLWRWETAQLCFKQVVSLTLPSSSLLSFTLFMCVKTKAASLSAHEDTMRPEELVRGGVVVVVREAKKGVCVCVLGGRRAHVLCGRGVKHRTENLTSVITRPLLHHINCDWEKLKVSM